MRKIAWLASLLGSVAYLALTLYLLFGLATICPQRVVASSSLQNLALLLGYGAAFALVWFVAPPNPLVKVVSEIGAVLLFALELLMVVAFGALVYLFDGRAVPFGC